MAKFTDIADQKFGKLKVLKVSHIADSGHYMWECLCDCGNIAIVAGSNVRKGTTTSCGCYRKELIRKEKGVSSWNYYFDRYKRDAKRREREFNLTLTQFKEMCSQDCYYSGHPPRKTNAAKRNKKATKESIERQWIYANGIDRIDNTKGYTLDNVVPCCKLCNQMKHKLNKIEFYQHIETLYKNLIKKDIFPIISEALEWKV